MSKPQFVRALAIANVGSDRGRGAVRSLGRSAFPGRKMRGKVERRTAERCQRSCVTNIFLSLGLPITAIVPPKRRCEIGAKQSTALICHRISVHCRDLRGTGFTGDGISGKVFRVMITGRDYMAVLGTARLNRFLARSDVAPNKSSQLILLYRMAWKRI